MSLHRALRARRLARCVGSRATGKFNVDQRRSTDDISLVFLVVTILQHAGRSRFAMFYMQTFLWRMAMTLSLLEGHVK